MANYVRNVLEVTGNKRVLDFFDFVQNEKGDFDFNKIIPMPESLNMTSGTSEIRAVWYFCQKNNAQIPPYLGGYYEKSIEDFESKLKPGEAELLLKDGEKYMNNHAKYGYTSWYFWCSKNWGTKWNACESKSEKLSRPALGKFLSVWTFDTAWEAPEPIFKELARKFPDLEFKMVSANEDFGCPVSVMTGKNGETEIYYIGGGEGEEIASELFGIIQD